MAFYEQEPVPKIDADTAAAEIDLGAKLLDIGEPEDWYKGYIAGSILVEPELLDIEVGKLEGHPKLIIASRDQGLAEEVAAALRVRNWDAVVLDGGPHAWSASGREVVRTK